MARRLRLQYPDAIYHIINRGNYRRDLFETAGAASSFENTLGEASSRFGWQVHAFAIMRNHFHLALSVPTPNLAEGMHWLQGTFAVRFNRYRDERGHVYQGRYQSPVVEDSAALLRLVNYIHLNPVRAGIVPPERVADFRWSSLARLVKGPRPRWLDARGWLAAADLDDSRRGWAAYVDRLVELALNPEEQNAQGFDEIARGWAVGTPGWRRALARAHRHRALDQDMPREEILGLRVARWEAALDDELSARQRNRSDLLAAPKHAEWKLEIAAALRRRAGAPYRWITEQLSMGSPLAVRVAVYRRAGTER